MYFYIILNASPIHFLMQRKQKLQKIIEHFQHHLPQPETELHYKNEYELAVAVILSAQCTDKRVNMITPALFDKWPGFESLAKGTVEQVYEFIKSCSYPNNKSKHLIGLAKRVKEEYNGSLPRDVKTLMSLPGIGRKTAHVLLSVLQNENVLAVDTHVFRVSHRIGIVNAKAKTPLAVEKQIVEIVADPDILSRLHHWLILHGRYVCHARSPNCDACGLQMLCSYFLAKK
jgi:endonuclease III